MLEVETQMGSQGDVELLLCLSKLGRKVFPVDSLYNGICAAEMSTTHYIMGS